MGVSMKLNAAYFAVVVGQDHQNTLGVVRSLGESGIHVIAVLVSDEKACFTAHSKYISETVFVNGTELVDTLIRLGERFEKQIPLIPCGDDTAAPIACSYDQLKKFYILPRAADGEDMARLMSKSAMMEAAKSAGLAVPAWVCVHREDFPDMERLCKTLRFPRILKPVAVTSGGLFKYLFFRSEQEMLDAGDFIARNYVSVIVQEYIVASGEYGVNGCRLYNSGDTIFGGIIEKKRFSQSSLGSTTAGIIMPDVYGLCDAVKSFVEHIDYRGIFDVEFVTDGQRFYFVEMNFRNGGYGYAYTKAGRNFPAIWVVEAYGMEIDRYLRKPEKSCFFVNESADFQNVRAGNISVFTWIYDVLRAKAHMYINSRDMMPLLKKIIR